MGALTDNRKRCFVDLCFPVPPSSYLDLSHDPSSVPKKLKFSSPLVVNSSESAEEEEKREKKGEISTSVRLENPRILLPAPPRLKNLRRVQGPQRLIRVFGLGNPDVRPELQENSTTMSNLVPRVAKKTQLCTIWRNSSRKGKLPAVDGNEKERDRSLDDGSVGELKLEEYKRLVEEVDEEKLVASTSKGSRGTTEEAISDFKLLGGKIAETSKEHILNRKVDEEKSVRVKLTLGSDNVRWTKTVFGTPAYKDLLEKTRKYDLRLSSLDFELKLAEEKLGKFRIPKDEKPEEDLLEPFAPLTDEEEHDINIALRNPNRSSCWSDILVTHESSNIEINREKMQCLKRGAWLNDEVINLYLELLKEREKRDPKKFLNCHFFNTFFYKKDLKTGRRIGLGREHGDGIYILVQDAIPSCFASSTSDDVSSYLWHCRLGHPGIQKLQQAIPWMSISHFDCESCQLVEQVYMEQPLGYAAQGEKDQLTSGRDYYDFKSVRRWTTKRKIGYSLMDCDKIFVPIHKEIHWCLAVINIKDKKFQYLDSLGHMDEVVLAVLARYLTDEVKDKNGDTIDVSTWKREFVDGLPLQHNGWDCGMFMLKYTDFYSRGLGLKFSQQHMDYFRRRTVKELLRLKAE